MKVGIVGWRGMVGSVLLQRMQQEGDFALIDPVFFSTSQAGQTAPAIGQTTTTLLDATDLTALANMDAIITCQGGAYTNDVHPALRASGWDGYWIDAASSLRMQDASTIILDPVNRDVIDRALTEGKRDFIGGNCTVSLMMMALAGLFREGLIDWITAMTYQAASGAGARAMLELVEQMGHLHGVAGETLKGVDATAVDVDAALTRSMHSSEFPLQECGAPLAGSLIPWIDSDLGHGQSREEWKAQAECNKMIGRDPGNPLVVDGICVRVGAMRSHSQALTIKLTRDVPLDEINRLLASGNEWVSVVPNTRDASIPQLSPAAISGTPAIAIGRLRKMGMGPEYLSAFTVGDQLLWGAAEPLRRMLRILIER
jgi:aspartate-semialdehyde dehydrogenase